MSGLVREWAGGWLDDGGSEFVAGSVMGFSEKVGGWLSDESWWVIEKVMKVQFS